MWGKSGGGSGQIVAGNQKISEQDFLIESKKLRPKSGSIRKPNTISDVGESGKNLLEARIPEDIFNYFATFYNSNRRQSQNI
ncbi:MAG: hypothetical protein NPIRA06_00750 [Nitrospirales bacterium]|nr:MAG: hypothetical protein NPIRA06_00750 [Nitrospirales bacterium]